MNLIGSGILKINGYSYPVFIDSMEYSVPDNHTEFSGSLVSIGEPDCCKPSKVFFDLFKSPEPSIKKVIFNDPATVVMWSDGTKTVVKCQPGDTYSKETGLALCIAKKYLGNKGDFNEVFKKWIPEETEPVVEIPVDVVSPWEIKVGDKVRVVNCGEHYPSFKSWVFDHVTDLDDQRKWSEDVRSWDNDSIGLVKYIAPHGTYVDDLAYVDFGDSCSIIGIDGLEKVMEG